MAKNLFQVQIACQNEICMQRLHCIFIFTFKIFFHCKVVVVLTRHKLASCSEALVFSQFSMAQLYLQCIMRQYIKHCIKNVCESFLKNQLVYRNTRISVLLFYSPRSCMFRPESLEQVMSACHGTNGIEIYITTERLMILDCQPLLSSSIMDRLITQEKKFTSDYK